MLAVIEIPYDSWEKIQKLSAEAYQALRAEFPALNLPEDQTRAYWSYQEVIVDSDELTRIVDRGMKPTIKRVKGLQYPVHPSTVSVPVSPTALVATTGVSLFQVRHVTWVEDCCTQHLQGQLDAGWRIIAVCPPNDTRRPTYILGKTEEP